MLPVMVCRNPVLEYNSSTSSQPRSSEVQRMFGKVEGILSTSNEANRTRITFIGEDFWTAHLAVGLNARCPEQVECTAIRLRGNPKAFPQVVWKLVRDDVFVRVGFPPTVLSFEEYDEAQYAHRTGLKENAKRILFRTAVGRALRRTVLFMRTDTAWKWRTAAEWLQRHSAGLGLARRDFIYWIGSDVLNAYNAAREGTMPPSYLEQVSRMRSITGADRLTQELGEIGITSETVPYPGRVAHFPDEIAPMPREMTVLTYIPDFRREFYGIGPILGAARRLADVRFLVMGGDGSDLTDIPPNVSFLGFVEDPQPLYDQSSVVIRHVEHDGAGYSMVEGLLHGRPVIYSYDVPYAIHVPFGDEDGLVAALERLRAQHLSGGIPLNTAGRDWAAEEYDVDRRFRYLCEILTKA